MHTGPIYAVMNSSAQLSGIAAPPLVGYCVDRYGARRGFAVVFFMCAALYCAGAGIWAAVASARQMDVEVSQKPKRARFSNGSILRQP